MTIAERLFWTALVLQLLSRAAAVLSMPELVSMGLFLAWVVLVPMIGYLVGKSGGTSAQTLRIAGLLVLAWFVLGALALLFDDSVAPNLMLTALGGFVVSCLLGAIVLLALAAVSTKFGRLRALQPNSTPHTDARDVPASASDGAARAGERER